MIPLLDDPAPITHAVTSYCEIRIPESEVDFFEENLAALGALVMVQFSRCAVVVLGVVYEETDEEDDE